jgi:hypothetical protein
LEVKLVQKLFQCSPVVLFKLWYQSYTIESRCFFYYKLTPTNLTQPLLCNFDFPTY